MLKLVHFCILGLCFLAINPHVRLLVGLLVRLWGGKLKFHLLFFPFAEFSPIFILVSEFPDVIRTEPLPLIFNKNNPTREGTEAGVSVCAFVCQCV